jgi:hypothetical protein
VNTVKDNVVVIDDEFIEAVNEHCGVIPLNELIKISKPKPVEVALPVVLEPDQ